MPPPVDLTALLGSRICHDLVNPLSAIGNGVELLAMTDYRGPELALIADSVAHATARLKYFRIAYGVTSETREELVGATEIRSIIADMTRGSRLEVDWRIDQGVPRVETKLAFLGLLCVETALAFGGRISVEKAGDDWLIRAEAPRMVIDPALWARLTPGAEGGPEDGSAVASAQIQFLLFPAVLEQTGRRARNEVGEGWIELRF